MQNTTPMFPGFHLQTLRRKARSGQQKLADELAVLKQKSFAQLGEAFAGVIPDNLLAPRTAGGHSRCRLYSKSNTFWAFMGQMFSEDGSCQEVVQKLKAYAALRGLKLPSSNTASYCNARSKLPIEDLQRIDRHVAASMLEFRTTLMPFFVVSPWKQRVVLQKQPSFLCRNVPM